MLYQPRPGREATPEQVAILRESEMAAFNALKGQTSRT